MDVSKYDIEIKRHAFIQAMQRGIAPDLIEDTIKNGGVENYGKHGIRFIKKGSKRTLICVGQREADKIKIFTIEEGK